MKIVHFSDTHLGHSDYGKFDSESGINKRENDVYVVFKEIIDYIIKTKPDLVIHAGDLFDSIRPSNRAISVALEQLSRLSKEKTLSTKKENVQRRKILNNIKKEVLAHYSKGKTKCNCCGFDNLIALTMDHIKGRKDVKHRVDYQGKLLYYWLRRNEYPKDFQVLCIMCNLAKHDNDICPHQK